MIPITEIGSDNLYSTDDAPFLLGEGFSSDAAREAISEACRSGELKAKKWRKRYWFSGREFLAWVQGWYGTEVSTESDRPQAMEHVGRRSIALHQQAGHDDLTDPEPVAARRGGGR